MNGVFAGIVSRIGSDDCAKVLFSCLLSRFLLPLIDRITSLDFNDAWQWWVMHAPQRQETRV